MWPSPTGGLARSDIAASSLFWTGDYSPAGKPRKRGPRGSGLAGGRNDLADRVDHQVGALERDHVADALGGISPDAAWGEDGQFVVGGPPGDVHGPRLIGRNARGRPPQGRKDDQRDVQLALRRC